MRYSTILSDLIEKSGLSLTEISERVEKLGHKITPSYLSKLKNAKMPPPSYKISVTLANVLGVDPVHLLAAGQNDIAESTKNDLIEVLKNAYPENDFGEIFEKAMQVCLSPYQNLKPPFQDSSVSELQKVNHHSVLRVPLVGSVPTGISFDMLEFESEHITISNMWNLKEKEIFVLKVSGDSMINSRIFDGDLVVVKIQSTVESGEIAVVNVNGDDATLKRVKRTPTGQIILFPDNPKYEPCIIDPENDRIIGKVIQVIFDPNQK